MKAGIVTITGEANYGNSLQNYAVEQVLTQLGVEAQTISFPYHDKLPFKRRVKNLIKKYIGKGNKKQMKRREHFYRFNDEYLHFADIDNTADCDYFVCGSDQIWNPRIFQVGRHLGYYFADFAPEEKRVAYSASIGIDFFPDNHKANFEKYLRGMKSISVRETKAAEMIEELTGIKSTVTIDPTLMLPGKKWLEIAKKPSYVNDGDKYILTYFLGDDSPSDFIKKVADRYSLKVISLETEWKNDDVVKNEQWFYTRPDELIWLIKNSQLVVTDSYHASVFSIMFEKPFRCFSRTGGTSAGSRMATLFDKFKVSSWCIGDENESLDDIFKTDFPCSEEVLEKERTIALDYLRSALGIKSVPPVKPDKSRCVGCGACADICPKGCIKMAEDKEGFLYPELDMSKCIGCNKCARACVQNRVNELDELRELECYACMSRDDDTRLKSSSGGLFSLLGEYVIENGGVVYGACYDDDYSVIHTRAQSTEQLERMRGSKYAQSSLKGVYTQVKADLEDGRTVLFTGTGCQINALKSYLNKDYEGLYTADVVCHGVPSSDMFKKYLSYLSDKKLLSLTFKDKSEGWTSPSVKFEFEDKIYKKNLYLDSFALLFTSGVTLRQSCYHCYSSAAKSLSDLSLGDFWGIENTDKQMFDDKGTSLVLVKSEKGKVLLDTISDKIVIKAERLEDALKRNYNVTTSTKPDLRRTLFFNEYTSCDSVDFDALADKYVVFNNKPLIQKLKIKVKRMLNKE